MCLSVNQLTMSLKQTSKKYFKETDFKEKKERSRNNLNTDFKYCIV